MDAKERIKRFRDVLFRRKQLHADYSYTFGTPEGKRVLADICRMGYISNSSFAPLNASKTLMNEGARNLALAILNKTHKQPIEVATESIIGD